MTTPTLAHTQEWSCHVRNQTWLITPLFSLALKCIKVDARGYRNREMEESIRGPAWEARKWEIPTCQQSVPTQSAHNVLLHRLCSKAGGFGTDMVWNSQQIFKTEPREQRRALLCKATLKTVCHSQPPCMERLLEYIPLIWLHDSFIHQVHGEFLLTLSLL